MDKLDRKFTGVLIDMPLYQRGKRERLSFSKVLNEALTKRFEDADKEFESIKMRADQYKPIVEPVIEVKVDDAGLN